MEGGKILGEQQIRYTKGIKGTRFLLTVLWTPPANPPTSLWESLTHGFLQLAHRHP